MRILNILPYSPCPPHFGGALRIFHLLRAMAGAHEVTVIMYGSVEQAALVRESFGGRLAEVRAVAPPANLGGVRKRLAQAGSLLRATSATTRAWYSAAMQEAIDRATSAGAFDIVQSENHHTGLFRVDSPGALRVMDTQNVEHDNVRRMAEAASSPLRRAFYAREFGKVFREEKEVYGRQDALFVTSERDKALLEADFPGPSVHVVPNGVDTSYFRAGGEAAEPHTLVFTGAMNYFPNADGMLYFLREIFPLVRRQIPDARVSIVGGGPPRQLSAMASPEVTVTGYVPDVRPYVARAGVYVVPLRMGGGTRLKVLEAMAMEKPVVTTRVGCEGIRVEDRASVLLADAPEQFASAVVELMRDADLRRKLVRNGRELVNAEYEWSVIGDRLNSVYASLGGARRAGVPRARVEPLPSLAR